MSKLSQVIEGWKNHLIPPENMKEFISMVSKDRMEICNICPENSKNKSKSMIALCSLCGCPLITKTKALTAGCPINKWEAILTQEEREAMENKIKNKDNEKE